MINFPDARGEVAVVDEVLRERSDVRLLVAEMPGIGEHARLLRIQPRHERRPARVANRILTVRLIKPQPALGQPVDIRRVDQRMPIAAEIGIEVIHGNEQDVRRGGVNSGRGQENQ